MKKLYDEPVMMITRFEVGDVLTQTISAVDCVPGVEDWETPVTE